MKKVIATLIKNRVTSTSNEAHTLFQKSRFGERLTQKIAYSSYETLFLVENKKMEIFDFRNNPLSEIQLLKRFCQLNKNFQTKYIVFKDLREKGYIVKTALKFGTEFRVYNKGSQIDKSHSKWLCYPVQENSSIKWQDFTAKNRVAHSSKKNLLLAIVDEENQVSYYEISWTRA
jgi:tRNA-intron endonuclease, archaea type